MAAGVGIGIYKDMKSAANELVTWEKEYQSNRDNFQRYQELKKRWLEVYQQELGLVDKGLTTSMWQAPGL